ncbi:MAG: response regulator, partial [Magnetococcales bacterium]|nr:response regulator [Magnetococcales bacterium]
IVHPPQPEPEPVEHAPGIVVHPPQMANTVRIATDKLDQLLLRTVELITLKLAGHQHLSELRQREQTIELWHQKWGAANPFWRSLRKRSGGSTETGGRVPGSGGNSQTNLLEIQEIGKFLAWNQEYIQTENRDIKTLAKNMDQHQRILDRMVDEMIEIVKQMLMLPSATLLDLFPRMVREIAHAQGKEVELHLSGGDVEVDRRILEEMKDPLTHMIRNAIDHGIEQPSERLRRAKPRQGTVRLDVVQIESDKIEIRVIDDGQGIPLSRIKESAIQNGLLARDDAQRLADEQTMELIFHSGISSASIITDLSGRGLGMAIVKERVEKLGGNLEMANQPGKGLAIHIRLPISLATFRGVLIRSGRHLFVIPSTQVDLVMRITRDEIKMLENRATISCKGIPLSLVDLDRVMGNAVASPETGKDDKILVAVLAMGERRVGFRIDDLLGEQEVLVKSLGSQLQHVRHLTGATILGSGQVVPILNVHDLLNSAADARSNVLPVMATDNTDKTGSTRKSILVVEDSLTSRMLLKNILEAASYTVQTAVDGLDAVTILKTSDVDLVVSDVEMPRMNGFELTETIRADANLASLPVILVTSLSSREDRERGVAAGANAYIVKGNFEQGNLLEIVARLA